jgi:hypothetical protein
VNALYDGRKRPHGARPLADREVPPGRPSREGRVRTFEVGEAPRELIDIAIAREDGRKRP